jgi:uncharacterized protein YyaL (SSP411 family)
MAPSPLRTSVLFPTPGWRAALATALALLVGGHGDTAQERAVHENRLSHETSPYLLQHAHNPVDWYPWGEEAFARARDEGKPVFLSVGYSTCHWCHVMEKESFEDEEVAAFLNAHFVAIKVDREERPDVDDLYMTAVQMMSGHGGWPMSVWLTADRRPFFGATYFPKRQFLDVLARIDEAWTGERESIDAQATRVAEALSAQKVAAGTARALGTDVLERAVAAIAPRFDKVRGGFAGAPKFPSETTLLLLLSRFERTGETRAYDLAAVTLDQMARGGIYDQAGGGFHRYSVDADWLVPHFEKMLYNQAWLTRAYLEAYRLGGDPAFLRVVRETLAYVLRDMTSPEGAFYTAEDADSEGEEGKFYVWTAAEIDAALPADDATLAKAYYGVTPAGNFEHGATILHVPVALPDFARARKLDPAALAASLDRIDARLRDARGKRVRPLRDDKILSGWNGMMIGAFARAGADLGDESYQRAAERAAEFVLTRMRDAAGSLLRTHRAGTSKIPAFQEDFAYLLDGLLELHRATGAARWLEAAQKLADEMLRRFWDAEGGGFFATSATHEALLVRSKDSYDGAVPSGNAVAAHALARLARATGDRRYAERAEQTLAAFATGIEAQPVAYTHFLQAAEVLEDGEVGSRGADRAGVVRLAATPASIAVAAGATVAVTLRAQLRPGWHVQSHHPASDAYVPTLVALDGTPAGLTLQDVAYPDGKSVRLAFEPQPLSVYEGAIEIPLRLAVGKDAVAGPRVARVRLRFQACDDRKCLPPDAAVVSVALRVPSRGAS